VRRKITVGMLLCLLCVPICIGQTVKVLSGRDLLRAVREKEKQVKTEPNDHGREPANALIPPTAEETKSKPVSSTPKPVLKPKLPESAATRVLHFPKDRSLGTLKVPIDKSKSSYELATNGYGPDWDYFGQARGDVRVPKDKRVMLQISRPYQDWSPLAKLQPDDLFMIIVDSSFESVHNFMKHIGGLRELEALRLYNTDITSKEIRILREFKKLKYLFLIHESQIDNAALATLSKMESLEVLQLYNDKPFFSEVGRVTDAGLSSLGKMKSLRDLVIMDGKVRGPGLAHLSQLPSLQYLEIGGKRLSEDVLEYVGRISSLKRFRFKSFSIGKTGFAHLSKLKELEELDLKDKICLEELKILSGNSSLKKLKVKIKSSVDEDKMLELLSNFKKLEWLSIESVTNKGVSKLAELENLKTLEINSNLITDAGMSHIAKLNNLRSLRLVKCKIGDEGFAKLASLGSLESIGLYFKHEVSVAGLNYLNTLIGLTKITVHLPWGTVEVKRYGNTTLNFSDLTQLEYLELRNVPLRDEDMLCLRQLRNLRRLTLRGSISDSGLSCLTGLTNLERVAISIDENHTPMTDRGLQHLSNLKKLNHLYIGGLGDFTDNGIGRLEGFEGLRYLHVVSKNKLNPLVLKRLWNNHPNIQTLRVETEKRN
jgi:Leucine-rich repeat (LRR) protein